MKTRMVNKVAQKVRIIFDDIDAVEFGHFPLETTMDDVREQVDAVSVLGKRIGWGLMPIYDTPTGDLEPGCMFWNEGYAVHHQWDNDSAHLCVMLPNRHIWDIDSRARNCTMPNDRTHRCWVRTGTPPNITVGKGGHTCSAGAGSILAGDYHGFLIDGELRPC